MAECLTKKGLSTFSIYAGSSLAFFIIINCIDAIGTKPLIAFIQIGCNRQPFLQVASEATIQLKFQKGWRKSKMPATRNIVVNKATLQGVMRHLA